MHHWLCKGGWVGVPGEACRGAAPEADPTPCPGLVRLWLWGILQGTATPSGQRTHRPITPEHPKSPSEQRLTLHGRTRAQGCQEGQAGTARHGHRQGLAPSLLELLLPLPVGSRVPAWHMPAICSPCHSILSGPASSLLAGVGVPLSPNCYSEQAAQGAAPRRASTPGGRQAYGLTSQKPRGSERLSNLLEATRPAEKTGVCKGGCVAQCLVAFSPCWTLWYVSPLSGRPSTPSSPVRASGWGRWPAGLLPFDNPSREIFRALPA